MERREGSGRDPDQPLPLPPSRAWGGLWGQSRCVLSLCAGSAVPAIPMAACHTAAPPSQSPGTWPHAPLPRGAAVPSSSKHGAARRHRLEEREGRGALPALPAGTDCEQLRADKERWRSAAGRRLLPLQGKLSLFLAHSGSDQAASWAGNLLCCRDRNKRMDDVRAGTRVADFSLFADFCFISLPRGPLLLPSSPCPGWVSPDERQRGQEQPRTRCTVVARLSHGFCFGIAMLFHR